MSHLKLLLALVFIGGMQSQESVTLEGPVHVRENIFYPIVCSVEPGVKYTFMSINHGSETVISADELVAIEGQYRQYIRNAAYTKGSLFFHMKFSQEIEGVYTCQIITGPSKKVSKSINIFFNAPSPILQFTKKEVYEENEQINITCKLNRTIDNVGISTFMRMVDGAIIEHAQQNSSISSAVSVMVTLTRSMNGAFIGCGIKYTYSTYRETFSNLSVIYPITNVMVEPSSYEYYFNTKIKCLSDGNPLPNIKWKVNGNIFSYNDSFDSPFITFSTLRGIRNYSCVASQTYNGSFIIMEQVFTLNVIEYISTLPPTARWNNIRLVFEGDVFEQIGSSNHIWRMEPKWVGIINGTISVNGSILLGFNSSSAFGNNDYLYNVSLQQSGLTYNLKRGAIHGLYECRIQNMYHEYVENSTIFIRGSNPLMTMERKNEILTVNCTSDDLGSPGGVLEIKKESFNGSKESINLHVKTSNFVSTTLMLDWTWDGSFINCQNENKFYTWKSNSSKIEVEYPVRDLEIISPNSRFEVGTVVRCTAKGNPSPTTSWISSVPNSFLSIGSPNIIQLTPPPGLDVNYTCESRNNVTGRTTILTQSVLLKGNFKEIINFEVNPKYLTQEQTYSVSCQVERLSSINVMNIKMNGIEILSVTPLSVSLERDFRSRIEKINNTDAGIMFNLNLKNHEIIPNNFSCDVIFSSRNMLTTFTKVKVADIKYSTLGVKEGVIFIVNCTQYLGNQLTLKLGWGVNASNIISSVISDSKKEMTFENITLLNYNKQQFFCALYNGSIELGREYGDKFNVIHPITIIEITSSDGKFQSGTIAKCIPNGFPAPKVTWSSKPPNAFQIVDSSNAIQLIPPPGNVVTYTCEGSSNIDGILATLNKSVTVRGDSREVIRFEVDPKYLMKNISYSVVCEVELISSINVMNVKVNNKDVISVTPLVVSLDKDFRSRISLVNTTTVGISFFLDLNGYENIPNNFSCAVIFNSKRNQTSVINLKTLDIKYAEVRYKEGENIQITCTQFFGDNFTMRFGWGTLRNNYLSSYPSSSNFSNYFQVIGDKKYNDQSFFCALYNNSLEIGKEFGKRVTVIANDTFIIHQDKLILLFLVFLSYSFFDL